MLGWDDNPSETEMDRATRAQTWLTLVLLGYGGRTGRMLCAGLVGLLFTLLSLLFNPLLLFVALPSVVAGLIVWERLAAA